MTRFVDDIIAQGEHWTDPDFGPTMDSFCKDGPPDHFNKCE